MKRRMLDSDILSMYLKGDPDVTPNVSAYLSEFDYLTLSIISEYEIRRGLEYKNATTQLTQFEAFVGDNEVLAFNANACKIAARLYATLRHSGQLIADGDLLIAASALAHDCVLVTNNERHFQRVSELRVENWKR
ncbi:type II toxin-antitoxin system VapC family toxin [Candidatus Entotheonella palauensis]|uniref:type II toxin-antitoxin system VapC family toxin n=1 Tax=Candidatus Entotheonella palauensis TaxID=93172 RepID=UPI000B7D0D71|nr:type II toxin-antitoxin system VapC family toxin [Candidatus Entotheonella palauensis]